MQKFYGDSTHWGIGVVEDIQDPLNQGRVRVRIHGLHTFDTNKLAAHELPWSAVAIAANNAGTSGIGQTPTGLVEGSFVFGIFLDGADKQDFLVTNSLTGTDTATARQGQLLNQITSSLYGDSNPERMYSYFRDILGFTEEEAAGALGAVAHFMGDYTLGNVDIDHGEGRYGLGNWDEDATAALRAFASGTAKDYTQFDTQLLFLGNGLQHSDSWPNYSAGGQQLGAFDASQAADSFATNVLGLPLDQERQVRHTHARQAMDAYGSSTTGDRGLFPERGAPTDLVTGAVLPSEEHVYRYIRSLNRHIAELIVTDTNTQPGQALPDDWADETHFLITEDGAIQIGTLANQPVENMPAGSSVTADGEMLPASRFTTSTEMRDQIKTWEDIRLEPYVDAYGYSIGYGYFIGTDDQPERFEAFSERWMGTATSDRSQISITRAQANELFDETIVRFERIVQNAVNVDITQSQFDALVAFTYNLGGFSGAQRLIGNLNSGNYAAAADAFTLYVNFTNMDGERIRSDHLYSRRLVESEYFRRGLVGVNGIALRNHRQFSIVVTFQGGQRRGGGRATTYTNEQFNALREIAGATTRSYPAVSIIGLRDLDETSNRPLFDVRQFFESTSPNTTSNPQPAPATVSDTSGVQGSSASAGGDVARPATPESNSVSVNQSANSPSVEPDVPTPNADHTPVEIDLDADVVETVTGEIADLSAPTPPTSIPSPFLDPILGVVGASSGLGLDLSGLGGSSLTEAEVQALIDGSLVAYYTSSQVDNLLTSYYTSSQVDTLLDGLASSLNDLTDVTLSSPSTGQYLRYNGADWVNATIDYADITGTPGSGTFVDLVSDQSISGEKTFSATPSVAAGGSVLMDFTSTSNNAVQLRLTSDSDNRRIIGRTAANVIQSQVLLGDGEVYLLGTTTGDVFLKANATGLTSNGKDVFLGTETTPTEGQYLRYTSGEWVNATIDYSEIANTPTTLPPAAHTHVLADITDLNSTTDLPEGTNLYYTTARANTDIDARVTKSFVDALNVDADTVDGLEASAFGQLAVSNTWTQPQIFEGANGQIQIWESDAGVDLKRWTVQAQNEAFAIQTRDDAGGFLASVFRVNRSGVLDQISDIVTPAITPTSDLTITVDDADFIVADSTDATANYIWRDHSLARLYLGTPNAEVYFRSDINTNGYAGYFEATANQIYIRETDAAVGEKQWGLTAQGGVLTLQSRDDSYGWVANLIEFDRSGGMEVSGAVGIGGTPDANHSLHVQRGDNLTLAKFERTGANPGNVAISMGGNNAYINMTGNSVHTTQFASMANGEFQLSTSGTTALTVDTSQIATFASDVIVTGDLTVNGTQTVLNTTELQIEDNIITLNSGVTGTPSLNAGIEVERGTSANVQFRWNESTDKWQVTEDGSTYYDILIDDGAASGNANTLDGLDSTQFIRSDANDKFWSGDPTHAYMQSNVTSSTTNPGYMSWHDADGTRRGYLGYTYGTSATRFNTENGYGFFFTGSEEVAFINDLGVSIGTTTTADSVGTKLFVFNAAGTVAEFQRNDNGDILHLDGNAYSTYIGMDANRTYIRNNSGVRGMALGVNSQNNFEIAAGGEIFYFRDNTSTTRAYIDTSLNTDTQTRMALQASAYADLYLTTTTTANSSVDFRLVDAATPYLHIQPGSAVQAYYADFDNHIFRNNSGVNMMTLAGDYMTLTGTLTATSQSSYRAAVQAKNFDAAGWARIDLQHSSADDVAFLYQTSSGAMYFRNDATTSLPFLWSINGTNIMELNSSGELSLTGGVGVSTILDEDTMSSNSATALATQQSIKAYVDAQVSGGTGDAGTLDGLDSSQFLRSDQSDSMSGSLTVTGHVASGSGSGGVAMTVNDGYGTASLTFNHKAGTPEQDGNAARIRVNTDATTDAYIDFQVKSNVTGGVATGLTQVMTMRETGLRLLDSKILSLGSSDDMEIFHGGTDNFIDLNVGDLYVRDGTTTRFTFNRTSGILNATGGFTANGNTVWHAGNDGSGSGLDADLLDGQHGSFYQNANNINAGTLNSARLSSDLGDRTLGAAFYRYYASGETDITTLTGGSTSGHIAEAPINAHYVIGIRGNDSGDGFHVIDTGNTSGGNYSQSLLRVSSSTFTHKGNAIWHAGNDGSGSGLDADLLDGVQGSSYLRSDQDDSMNGLLTVNATIGDGVHILDSSNSSASPALLVRGNRSDTNTSQSFSGKMVLQGLYTSSAVTSGKRLGTIFFGGNHTDGSSSNISHAASISAVAEGTFNSATDMPTALVFYTGDSGIGYDTANATAGTETFRIGSDGKLTSTTSISGALFSLKGDGSTSGVYHGFFSGDYYIVNKDNERIVFGTNNTVRGYIENDGSLVWNDRGTTIGGTTWDNGWVKIGSSSLGWSIDSNEIYNAASSTIGTLSGTLLLDAATELDITSDTHITGNVAIGNNVQSARSLYSYRDASTATDTDEFANYSYVYVSGTPALSSDRGKYGVYGRSTLADNSTTSDSNVATLHGVYGYATITSGHSDSMYGVSGLANVNGGSDSNAANMYGGNFESRLDNAGSSVTTMYGVMGRVRTQADSDGSASTGYGVRSFLDHDGTGTFGNVYLYQGSVDIGAATGTISNLYGMHLNMRDSFDGTVTNRRGIWVEAPDTQTDVRNHIQGHTVFGGNGASFVTNDATVWIDDNQTTGTGLLVTGGGSGGPVARFRRDVGGTSEILIHHGNADPTIGFDASGTGAGDWSIGLTDSDNFIINNDSSPSSGTAEFRLDQSVGYLYLRGKEAIRYGDSWLRLNNSGSFANGIYCGSSIVRTDGQLQVGASGATFLVNGATITHQGNTVWTAGNDGAASGLDADLLDGVQGANYVRTDVNSTITADLIFNDNAKADFGNSQDIRVCFNGTNFIVNNTTSTGSIYFQKNGTTNFTFAGVTGDFTATGNVTANSDRNLKTILSPVWDTNIIDGLEVVDFLWKKNGKASRGVIAQDVEVYAPWFVVTGENGIKSVDYGKLATAAVYEEKKKREALEEKVEKLEAMVEMLMEKLNGSTE